VSAAPTQNKPNTIYLKDYKKPNFSIGSVNLEFTLGEDDTRIINTMALSRDGEKGGLDGETGCDLVLDGSNFLRLGSIEVDGVALGAGDYTQSDTELTLRGLPDMCSLSIETFVKAKENTTLTGLYQSSGNFCTQCEAQGFRNITYYIDRPDAMATFKVRIVGDKIKYPVLLSNGNLVGEGDLDNGLHFADWFDPFPKPAYLFALVAGDLAVLSDHYKTTSGRDVTLNIYVVAEDIDKCDHAMESLKRSMKWDEDVFGLEYDLDIYNIVAVGDFNMGAMENKGLNVFNTKYVLATKDTATDMDFSHVEGVIGHEYFHNWTGNRVTCRDWFQLSLKEGLTVFRDQEFTSDMGSRAVKRIDDVRVLRAYQFPEDSGPMAHPVRPTSYMEINNFYTTTVYNKGAEVIRMMHTLLGADNFRKGMDLYFERHDGQAVTCEDFASAMETASGVDLGQFRLWYSQAGTPVVEAKGEYDEGASTYTLSLKQSCPDTPSQSHKKPMHIPLVLGLVGPDGNDLDVRLDGDGDLIEGNWVLNLKAADQSFKFTGVKAKPVPSLLRGFSAPVTIKDDLTRADVSFLTGTDNDSFNRWEASQRLAGDIILDLVSDIGKGQSLNVDDSLVEAFDQILSDVEIDQALAAEALALPSENYLGQSMDVVKVDELFEARKFVMSTLAEQLSGKWRTVYDFANTNQPYSLSTKDVARRRIKNISLAYLAELKSDEGTKLCASQYASADNMTDVMGALSALVKGISDERTKALNDFYTKWQGDALVVDKWFAIQACSPKRETLNDVIKLGKHADFTLKNPNRLRSLVSSFSVLNQVCFHDVSGGGYKFLADMVMRVDEINPQTAARIMGPLTQWKRFDSSRQALMKAELNRILGRVRVSKDVFEIASKSL
jgi:aminopeptidase N